MAIRFTKPLIPPENPEEALTLFEEEFLQKVFQKGAEAITRVINLLEGSQLSPEV